MQFNNTLLQIMEKSNQEKKKSRKMKATTDRSLSKLSSTSQNKIEKAIQSKSEHSNLTPKVTKDDRSPNLRHLKSKSSQLNQTDMIRLRLKLLQSKMNHYSKEINLTIIKEFLKHQRAPSKLAFRAARCLCLLLNSFYHYPQQKDCRF